MNRLINVKSELRHARSKGFQLSLILFLRLDISIFLHLFDVYINECKK